MCPVPCTTDAARKKMRILCTPTTSRAPASTRQPHPPAPARRTRPHPPAPAAPACTHPYPVTSY